MAAVVHMSSAHPAFDIRIFYKECVSLHAEGHSVSLIVPHRNDETSDGITILSVSESDNRLQRMLKTTYQIYKRAVALNADIYHVHDAELLPYAQLLRLKGKKIIYDMHENLPKSIKTKAWISPPLRILGSLLYAFLEKILLYKIPVIFAETSYRDDYLFVAVHETIYNFPLIEKISAIHGEKCQIPTVGYFGVVSPLRGTLEILEAINILEKKGIRINFECIGPVDKGFRSSMDNIVRSYQVQKVFVRGYMKPYEGQKIMASCHIGLAILKNIPNYIESFPTKIFEYMALGLPVITSDFRLYKKIIQEANCGYCVNPDNPAELADTIEYLITNLEEAHKLGQNGKEAVKDKYSWRYEEIKLKKFYSKILNS